jgi:hypothetical protein
MTATIGITFMKTAVRVLPVFWMLLFQIAYVTALESAKE